MRFPTKITSSCHTCWLSYFKLVCLWCGWTDGEAYGHVITKISRMGRLPNFLTHGAPLRARGAPIIFLQRWQAKKRKVFQNHFYYSWMSKLDRVLVNNARQY